MIVGLIRMRDVPDICMAITHLDIMGVLKVNPLCREIAGNMCLMVNLNCRNNRLKD